MKSLKTITVMLVTLAMLMVAVPSYAARGNFVNRGHNYSNNHGQVRVANQFRSHRFHGRHYGYYHGRHYGYYNGFRPYYRHHYRPYYYRSYYRPYYWPYYRPYYYEPYVSFGFPFFVPGFSFFVGF